MSLKKNSVARGISSPLPSDAAPVLIFPPCQESADRLQKKLLELEFPDLNDRSLREVGLLGVPLSGLLLVNASGRKILKGPSGEVKTAYTTYHRIIHHSSPCTILNTAEHNFGNGYLCHVGQDPTILPPWPTRPFLNEWDGGPGCLLLIDCER